MTEVRKRELKALALLVGTIIGAGAFGVPYVLSRAGFSVGLGYFVVLTVIITLLHLYFGEIVLSVKAKHRFPGFAGIILGPFGKRLAAALGIFGGWLAILAYVVLGGTFLFVLVGPFLGGTEFAYQIFFTFLGAAIVWRGLRGVAGTELVMAGLLIVTLLIVSGVSATKFSLLHLTGFDSYYLLLPYGVIMFSLSGFLVIPELEDELAASAGRSLRSVIIRGTVLSAVLTLLFGLTVLGVTGPQTTPEAILGLRGMFGPWITVLGAIFGFLAIITSYLTFLMNQVETFQFDYRVSKLGSWLLAIGVPLLLFLFGARNFLHIIGLSGGFFGGLIALLLVVMYLKLKWRSLSLIGRFVPMLVAFVFSAGAIAELIVFLRGY